MFPSDIGHQCAGHFDRPWQEAKAARDDELARLLAAIDEPALPASAREALILEAVHRLPVPGELAPRRADHARLLGVLAARTRGTLASAEARALVAAAARSEADCDGYLAVAPGWAQGCEMEDRQLERAMARATVALAAEGAAAARGTIAACVEYVALGEQVDAYARNATHRTQSVTHALAHRREIAHLSLALLRLSHRLP